MTTSNEIATEAFETYRPLLFSIAYRMLGSASETDDILQETYLRYCSSTGSEIRSLKSYLTTIVTHLCLDYLKSARVQREQYIGPWLPEPLLTTEADDLPFATVEQHESISLAFLVLLEALTPLQRAVYLLHEVFDYDFSEIGQILGKSPTNCRQLFHRAKQPLAERRHRYSASRETQLLLIGRFLQACQEGDIQGLMDILAQDVTAWGDGGGKAVAARKPIYGVKAVSRFWLALAKKPPTNFSLTFENVNGSPAVLMWTGDTLFAVTTFDVVAKRIQGIYNIPNPDKIAYITRQVQAR